jgi:hypothetical protein
MINPKLKFGVYAFLLALVIVLAGEYIFRNWFPAQFFSGFYFVIAFILFVTITFHLLLISSSEKRPAVFVNRFLAFTGAKLLLYLMMIILYILFINNQRVSFLLTFLCGYFVFTIFEVTSILNFLRKKVD